MNGNRNLENVVYYGNIFLKDGIFNEKNLHWGDIAKMEVHVL